MLALAFALQAHGVGTAASRASTFWWILSRDLAWQEALIREKEEEIRMAGSGRVPRSTSVAHKFDHTAYLRARMNPDAEPIFSAPARGIPSLLVPFEPPTPHVLPDRDLADMRGLSEEATTYLAGRGLSSETMAAWELGHRGSRIAIPIRDYKQRLVGISGRLFGSHGSGPKYLHSLGFRRDFFLYGESKIVEGRTGYVVEGFFDVIGLWQSGYTNGVAIMGSYPSKHQIEKFVRFFSDVVVLGDGDKAGREMALKVLEALRPRMPARIVEIPQGKDPADLSTDQKIELLGEPDRPTLIDNRLPV